MDARPTVRPPFFDDFKCVGPACQVSCCTGFRFPLRRGEETGLPRETWTEDERGLCFVTRPNGDCPFWSPEHRCPFQRGGDQSRLPGVCRVFPRIVTDYPDRTELCLDVLCPEVYRLIATWEIGDLRVDGGAEPSDPQYRRRAEEMEAFRALELPGVEPVFADYLRRLGAYLLFPHYPVYADVPKARGVFGPVRRFVELMALRSREFAAPDGDYFDFLCREWRRYSPDYGFDIETDGCFESLEEVRAK